MALAIVPTGQRGYAASPAPIARSQDMPDGMVAPLRDGVLMVTSFTNRAKRFYGALAEIAHLLPDDGEKSLEGMRIVTEQRKWMMMVFSNLGAFVGKFYTLEKNLCSEMQIFWETASTSAPRSTLVLNMKATAKNMLDIGKRLDQCLAMVDKLEAQSEAVKKFNGQDETLQTACLEQLSKFGGARQLESRLEDMELAMKRVTNAQTAVREAATKLHLAEGKIPELSAKIAIMEEIANNEKRSMAERVSTAMTLEGEAKKKAEEAGHAMNKHYTLKICGVTIYEYKDNKGDAEKARAEKLRQYARQAQQDCDSQQDKAKKATEMAADVTGQLEVTMKEIPDLRKQLEEKHCAYEEAVNKLKKLEQSDEEERMRFGGISLKHIAELRHHMQEFPALLAPQTAEDRAMFTTMQGHLESHRMIFNRMEIFLDCDSDEKAIANLKALRPAIKNVLEQTTFYVAELGGLKGKIENDMQKIQYEHTLANGTAAVSDAPTSSADRGVANASPAPDPIINLADDDDDLW